MERTDAVGTSVSRGQDSTVAHSHEVGTLEPISSKNILVVHILKLYQYPES